MGKLDFSIIDPRIKPPSEKINWGGREKNKKITLDTLERWGYEYTITNEGSTTIIESDYRKTRFIGAKEHDKDIGVIRACGEVKRAVLKFQKENGKLRSYKYKSSWRNDEMLFEYIKNGGREVSLVDVDHCYWRILFINNIINEKLYLKYKANREARVVSVGCLNKTKTTTRKKGTEVLERHVIKNPLSWIWNFVCWTTYRVMKQVIKDCEKNVFAYQSDGVYLPTKYTSKAVKAIKSFDLECKVLKYEIIGRNGNYIVLSDVKTGELRRANLGKIRDLIDILPYIKYETEIKDDD